LANLLELYAHDFSEFHSLGIGADGRFGYKSLPLYWSDPNRYPFLVRVDGKLAGLALVKRGSEITGNPTVWDMAEFLFFADAEDVELERLQRGKCVGVFRGFGKFV
jgi:predicted acetyltransferase